MSYFVDNRFGNRIVDSNTCCANVSSYPELRQDVRDLEVVVLGMASMSLGPASSAPRRAPASGVASGSLVASAAAALTSRFTGMLGRSSTTAETPRPSIAPRPERAPEPLVEDNSPVARGAWRPAASVAADAAEARARNRPEVPRLNVEAVNTAAPPSNSFVEEPTQGACGICVHGFHETPNEARYTMLCCQQLIHADCLQNQVRSTLIADGEQDKYNCPYCKESLDIVDLMCNLNVGSAMSAAVEQQTRSGWVQRLRDGVGEVVGGAMGVLAGEQRQVFPQSSTTSFDPENGLSIAGSSTARSVATERSFDPERSVGYGSDFHEESDDEEAGATEPASAEAGVHSRAKFLYTEDYLNRLDGPALVQLRKQHKDANHLGTAKQHATKIDLKDDLMQITVDQALN